jgi:hypothetical protein
MGEISLRKRQASKGQILVLILLVIFGLIVVSGLISIFSGRDRGAPIVKEAYWLVDGERASTSSLGQEIEAHLVIEAVEQYSGSIVVKVRKDVRLWFDSDFAVSTTPVDLAGGDERVLEIAFTPDEASHGNVTGLRGYFIEVEFKATGTTWEMDDSYPPRLTVTT